jgi:hypothetical protein
MQVHGGDIAAGQYERCALALLGADRTEDVGGGRPLIAWRRRPCAATAPAAGDLVLLADPGLVAKPDLYRGRVDVLLARDLVQNRGETFLKCAIAPSAW